MQPASKGNMARTVPNRSSLPLRIGVIRGHCFIRSMTSKRDRNTLDFCKLCGEAEELCYAPKAKKCNGWTAIEATS